MKRMDKKDDVSLPNATLSKCMYLLYLCIIFVNRTEQVQHSWPLGLIFTSFVHALNTAVLDQAHPSWHWSTLLLCKSIC